MKDLLLLFFLTSTLFVFSQDKMEYEERISKEEAPPKALVFIQESFPENPRTRWYLEHGTEQNFECKFKHQKKHYSVEFDSLGNLVEVEFVIKQKAIPDSTLEQIKTTLDSTHQKYKFRKIQKQLVGTEELVQKVLLEKSTEQEVQIHYEIVIRTRTKEGYLLFEHLFDVHGQLVRTYKILPMNTDFLDF